MFGLSKLNRKTAKYSIVRLPFVLAIPIFFSACQAPADHPWKTKAYAPPSKYKPVPKSTYAPVPSILPSVQGTDLNQDEADSSLDGEFEQVLRELEID